MPRIATRTAVVPAAVIPAGAREPWQATDLGVAGIESAGRGWSVVVAVTITDARNVRARRFFQGPVLVRGGTVTALTLPTPVTGPTAWSPGGHGYRTQIANSAQIPRHISARSLRHAAITNALDAGVPLRDPQILARHADTRTTEHYVRGNLDRHGVHFLTAYVVGVWAERHPGRSPAPRGGRCVATPTMGHKRDHPSSAPTR